VPPPAVDTAWPDLDDCPDATFEVGVGESAFEVAADLAALPIHCGTQGGYHAVTALRRCGGEGRAALKIDVVREQDGARVGGAVYPPVPLQDAEPCCAAVTNVWAYFEPINGLNPPDALAGEVVVVTYTVTDDDGAEHTASARFTAEPHEDCQVDTGDPP
jgi:hypothetical protein